MKRKINREKQRKKKRKEYKERPARKLCLMEYQNKMLGYSALHNNLRFHTRVILKPHI